MGSKKSKPKRVSRYESNTTAANVPVSQANGTDMKEFQQVHEDRVSCVAVYKPGVCVSGGSDTVR
jgi:hypothetical protein